jgi:hypothetical protein
MALGKVTTKTARTTSEEDTATLFGFQHLSARLLIFGADLGCKMKQIIAASMLGLAF